MSIVSNPAFRQLSKSLMSQCLSPTSMFAAVGTKAIDDFANGLPSKSASAFIIVLLQRPFEVKSSFMGEF